MSDHPFEDLVRPEEMAAVRKIIELAMAVGNDDENPTQSTMAILASAYTVAATALLMAGADRKFVRSAIRKDYDLCLRLVEKVETDPDFMGRPQ